VNPVAAGALGGIEVAVDPLEPGVVRLVGDAGRHPEAGGDAANLGEGTGGDQLTQFFRQRRGAAEAGLGEKDQKLLAAPAPERIAAAQLLTDAPAEGDQHSVFRRSPRCDPPIGVACAR